MQFKLKEGKGSVNRFVDADGITYRPGNIVDLSPNFKGERWLEAISKTIAKPMVPVSPKAEEPDVVPLPEKTEKKTKKPSKRK